MNEKNNIEKQKKIKLLVILIILGMSFIICGLSTGNTEKISNDDEIIKYLSQKYDKSDFKIEKPVDSRQYQIASKTITCGDGGGAPKKIKGKYEYYYDVISKSDDIKFNVYLIDDNGKLEISDSYDICKNMKLSVEQIQDYVIEKIGNQNSTKSSYATVENYTLDYSFTIKVGIDENFKNIVSNEFIDKLYEIYEYKCKVENDKNVFTVYIYDNTGKYINIKLHDNGFYVYDRNHSLGEISEYYKKNSGNQIIYIK